MEAIMCQAQIWHFLWWADEWDAKDGTGKSMKKVFYLQNMAKPKCTSWTEVMLKSETEKSSL